MNPSPHPAFADFLLAAAGRIDAYLRLTLAELMRLRPEPSADSAEGGDRYRPMLDFLTARIEQAGGAVLSGSSDRCAAMPGEHVDPGDAGTAAGGLSARLGDVAEGPSAPPTLVQIANLEQTACVAVLLTQIQLLAEFARRGGPGLGPYLFRFVGPDEPAPFHPACDAFGAPLAGVPVVVHQPTSLVPRLAGPGILPFTCRFNTPDRPQAALEIFPLVAMELEKLARRLREQAPGGPAAAPAVVCNLGVLGGYGLSAESAARRVEVEVAARTRANPDRVAMKLIEFLDEAAGPYTAVHGDSTARIDPRTGAPALRHHFDVQVDTTAEQQRFRIVFHGLPGPMGPCGTTDGAVTKAAYMLAALLKASAAFPNVKAAARLSDGSGDAGRIELRGAMSFLPPTVAADLRAQMRVCVDKAVQKLCRLRGLRSDPSMVALSFEDYCEPWTCAPDSSLAEAFQAAAGLAGVRLATEGPPPVSPPAARAARLGCPVVVFGPSDHAHVAVPDPDGDLEELRRAVILSSLVAACR